jgi:S-adenosylmethionine:tRNA ribosyltransferase-isomerase
MFEIPRPVGADPLITDYQYQLPPEAVAQVPTDRRDQARLLILDRERPEHDHHIYADLPGCVRGDELFVLNDTRVVPARLRARKETGGRVELLVTGPDPERPGAMLALGRSSKPLRPGARLLLDGGVELEILERKEGGSVSVAFPENVWGLLETHGELPLPPYIERPEGPTAEDRERYQTVFADQPGSSAAPTAGLHFTHDLLDALTGRGCEFARVTLHVGPGTFQPVRCQRLEDHVMHHETYEVSEEAAEKIRSARAAGRPVVAVGTTVVRTLESVALAHGEIIADAGSTNLFIRPGFSLQVVDQLLTNFHLPGSTLLMLVSAFAGRDRIMNAYEDALASGYRFFSYGDGMWIR